jgi:hypothetical protein
VKEEEENQFNLSAFFPQIAENKSSLGEKFSEQHQMISLWATLFLILDNYVGADAETLVKIIFWCFPFTKISLNLITSA